jgi:hypothetical protein
MSLQRYVFVHYRSKLMKAYLGAVVSTIKAATPATRSGSLGCWRGHQGSASCARLRKGTRTHEFPWYRETCASRVPHLQRRVATLQMQYFRFYVWWSTITVLVDVFSDAMSVRINGLRSSPCWTRASGQIFSLPGANGPLLYWCERQSVTVNI